MTIAFLPLQISEGKNIERKKNISRYMITLVVKQMTGRVTEFSQENCWLRERQEKPIFKNQRKWDII
jgi:hypothetical protein